MSIVTPTLKILMPWKSLALVSQLLRNGASYVIPTLMKQLVTGFEFDPELKISSMII